MFHGRRKKRWGSDGNCIGTSGKQRVWLEHGNQNRVGTRIGCAGRSAPILLHCCEFFFRDDDVEGKSVTVQQANCEGRALTPRQGMAFSPQCGRENRVPMVPPTTLRKPLRTLCSAFWSIAAPKSVPLVGSCKTVLPVLLHQPAAKQNRQLRCSAVHPSLSQPRQACTGLR